MVKVVAGIIFSGDKVLITRRKDRWEFPGGKVEDGETLFSALKREIVEELDFKISPKMVIGYSDFFKDEKPYRLIGVFSEALEKKEFSSNTGIWVGSDEILKYDFLEHDRKFLKKVLRELECRKKRKAYLEILKKYETSGQTFVKEEKLFPFFIKKAKGVYVWDECGKKYLDMTSFFGVAVLGHSPEFLEKTAKKELFHGMGDLIPSVEKIKMIEILRRFMGEGFTFSFHQNGSDAVEFAIRTAYLKRKSNLFLSFKGNYHGLTLGVLPLDSNEKFKREFLELLPYDVKFFAPEKSEIKSIEGFLDEKRVSAIIVEPIQMRGGVRILDECFLKEISRISKKYSIPLIFDEIYTSLWRSGSFLYSQSIGVEPDIVILGKALSGAFPLSITAVKRDISGVWEGGDESLYTHTFSGNPFILRTAFDNIREILKLKPEKKVKKIEEFMKNGLERVLKFSDVKEVRGKGVLWGIEFKEKGMGFKAYEMLLKEGIITLPSGEKGEVLSFSPPFIINEKELNIFFKKVYNVTKELSS